MHSRTPAGFRGADSGSRQFAASVQSGRWKWLILGCFVGRPPEITIFHDRTNEPSTGQVAIGGDCRTLPSQISAGNRTLPRNFPKSPKERVGNRLNPCRFPRCLNARHDLLAILARGRPSRNRVVWRGTRGRVRPSRHRTGRRWCSPRPALRSGGASQDPAAALRQASLRDAA
jgi:hypothetical protein